MASIPRSARRPAPPAIKLSLNDPFVRSIVYQILVVGGVALIIWYLVSNTMANMEARKIASGFGFLNREAGFAISENSIDYSPADTYFRALVVGVLNTLLVAFLGIIFATILGTLIGIGRLAKNWLIAKICSVYVEVMRNLPLAVQLFFWYAMIIENLPGPRQAMSPLPGVFLSSRGIMIPVPASDPINSWMLIAFLVGIAVSLGVSRWAKARQAATGQQFPIMWAAAALILGLPLLVWLAGGAPTTLDWPELRGFNFQGGGSLSPEFAALLLGLVTYTAAFIAEIVRSGILAVSHGQTEAASALGLRRGLNLRLVVLPQALRVIIPPMISQYLNITKNSSLAVLIGYPDIVSIANTALNQTGQAIEGIAIIMMVYLTVSLSIAVFGNWYNKRIALVER
jgi:general L-amino acid transport system permease protein